MDICKAIELIDELQKKLEDGLIIEGFDTKLLNEAIECFKDYYLYYSE